MLGAAGVRFEAAQPNIDEAAVKTRGGTAREIAGVLAGMKASAPLPYVEEKDAVIIGSDQTLEIEGRTMSKAVCRDELRANLLWLRGRTHLLHSAVAVAEEGEIVWSHTDTARLTMRSFSDAFLDDYLARRGDEVRSSLGGYWFEGEGVQLFDRVDGDYFTILGMPLLPLLGFLRLSKAIPS